MSEVKELHVVRAKKKERNGGKKNCGKGTSFVGQRRGENTVTSATKTKDGRKEYEIFFSMQRVLQGWLWGNSNWM